jgi:hypothetical protein
VSSAEVERISQFPRSALCLDWHAETVRHGCCKLKRCQDEIQPGYVCDRNDYSIMDGRCMPVVTTADLIMAGDQSG